MGRRALLAAVLAASLLAPAAAFAASSASSASTAPAAANPLGAGPSPSPFAPGIPQSSVPTQTATAPPIVPTTNSSGDSGLAGTNALLIVLGAVVVLVGISYLIWRDARRRAPARHRAAAATAGAGGRSGSKPKPKPRKLSPAERRRRKRGKAR